MTATEPFIDTLYRTGHLRDPHAVLTPLTGGISSEIYLVEDGTEKFVVKRALPQLNVKDSWFADVSRNRYEALYLQCIGRLLPGVVPHVRFVDASAGCFGMEYLGGKFSNWKQRLLAGTARLEYAERAGIIMGEIHFRTRNNEELREQFDTTENFRQLRIEPYLITTGARHPELREFFTAEAERLLVTREALVHGDFSPKNILVRGDRMVLLDGEAAWYGDPIFDVAFLLNHLFMKCLVRAPHDSETSLMINGFWRHYLAASGKREAVIEPRLVQLLPLLMLARVDGKAPLEYLDDTRQEFVRRFVYKQLQHGGSKLAPFVHAWLAGLRKIEAATVKHEN